MKKFVIAWRRPGCKKTGERTEKFSSGTRQGTAHIVLWLNEKNKARETVHFIRWEN